MTNHNQLFRNVFRVSYSRKYDWPNDHQWPHYLNRKTTSISNNKFRKFRRASFLSLRTTYFANLIQKQPNRLKRNYMAYVMTKRLTPLFEDPATKRDKRGLAPSVTRSLKQPCWTSTLVAWPYKRRGRPQHFLPVFETKLIFNASKYLVQYQKYWLEHWATNLNRALEKLKEFVGSTLSRFSDFKSPKVLTSSFRITLQRRSILRFYSLYKLLVLRRTPKLALYAHYLGKRKHKPLYKIYFTFHLTRLYINLWDTKNRNYVSLSAGLFLKFFQGKRSLKKNKIFRLLLVRFFRKILIVSGIKNVSLYLKKTPRDTTELFNVLNQPLPAPFFDPVQQKKVIETWQNHHTLDVRYLYFLRAISFTNMKVKKKGRLKRKIARKIIKKNKIMD